LIVPVEGVKTPIVPLVMKVPPTLITPSSVNVMYDELPPVVIFPETLTVPVEMPRTVYLKVEVPPSTMDAQFKVPLLILKVFVPPVVGRLSVSAPVRLTVTPLFNETVVDPEELVDSDSEAALILPVRYTVPEVFVTLIATLDDVNGPIFCVLVPVMVIVEVPPVRVPLLIKLPLNVSPKFPVASVAPLLIVSGIPALNTFAAFIVIVPVLAMITPPVAVNGVFHSLPAVLDVGVLYRKVAAEPYVSVPVTVAVAVPSMERIPFTVVVPVGKVFADVPERVRLL
jgi:hypothetical protein